MDKDGIRREVKRSAKEEGDNVIITLSEEQVYKKENMGTIIAQWKAQIKSGEEFLEKYDKMLDDAIAAQIKTTKVIISEHKEQLAMSEKNVKAELYSRYIKNDKANMLKIVRNEAHEIENAKRVATEQLLQFKTKIVKETKQLKQAVEMYKQYTQ